MITQDTSCTCSHAASAHEVDDEELRECVVPCCGCQQYECVGKVDPVEFQRRNARRVAGIGGAR